MTKASALIPAAGRGERFGRDRNKVLCELAGRPILAHTLSAFESCGAIEEIVIVTGEGDIEAVGEIVDRFGFAKVLAIVPGGENRQDSVRNGLARVTGDIVAIHDAARPLVTREIIEASIAEADRSGACIAAVPVIDTIKSASPDGVIESTIDRANLYTVQTPQTFRTDLIRRAFERAYADGVYATDDAALVERMGETVTIVPGSYDNIKLTTPADIAVAECRFTDGPWHVAPDAGSAGMLPAKGLREMRVGIGFDVHALVEGRRLVLGGVEIEFEKGLAGHSDADVLLHAIADALLGAAALGDIGRHFPDTDPRYKGISSLKLLGHVNDLLVAQGWRVVNVDSIVICERPKIAPPRPPDAAPDLRLPRHPSRSRQRQRHHHRKARLHGAGGRNRGGGGGRDCSGLELRATSLDALSSPCVHVAAALCQPATAVYHIRARE